MEMQIGQIVKSRKGRDVETLYVVVGIKENRIFLADGQRRTCDRPKQKNIRHLCPTNICLEPGEMGTDQNIKVALALYNKEHEAHEQGG